MSPPGRHHPPLAVVDAAGAAAHDARAIADGIPSRALMQRAGAAAAALVAEHAAGELAEGVVVATGGGNNGGDGWVVAHALHAAGIRVRVVECVAARTPDAIAERAAALAAGVEWVAGPAALADGAERVVVDALLGTGFDARTPLRGEVADAIARLRRRREEGGTIVGVDLPSGVDATTGRDAGCVRAHLSITFGTIKRGHLVARAECGRIVVVDIGLGAHGWQGGDATLATEEWFHASVPRIAASAHKGTRGKVAIIGGAPGMAGAVTLAAQAALRSGAGMVKCVVSPTSLPAVQLGVPAALGAEWPADDAAMRDIAGWADALLIGPGLGRATAREMVERALRIFRGPVVLDADALFPFSGDAAALRALLGERAALLTPHAVEFGRLAAMEVDAVLDARFTAPVDLARATGAAVLLKGVPTVVASPGGEVRVVAEGTPILATGGAGDLLGGIAVVLLAQTGDAALAGAAAAFAHGRAAARVSPRAVRGFTLEDVRDALRDVWSAETMSPRPPVLADLPAVGEEP